ncbi:hypothetical protein, partial [Escherichia coli]|uniref:hypothetical protein n=1 Tax=Escherichia coli TaxID=562 RepID=UPI001BC8B710
RSHAQYSAPSRVNPGRRKLAGASANCGILRRKSASSLSVSQSGLAGREGVPWFRLITVAALPRFGAMWLLCYPGTFVRPLHPLARITA